MLSRSNTWPAFNTLVAAALGLSSITSHADEFYAQSVIGDIDVGYRFQALEADVIQDAYVETTGMNILSLRFTPNISPALGAFLVYEFTPGSTAEQDRLVALQNQSENNGWKRLLANIRFDVSDTIGVGFRYDDQSFLNSVQSKRDLWFVTPTTAQLLIPGDNVTVSTVFTDIELYVALLQGEGSIDLGWFSTEYSKPLATDAITTVTTLFESELAASGLFVRASDIKLDEGWSITATAKYAFEPEVKVDGQNLGQLSGGSISSVNTLTYLEYGFSLSHQRTVANIPLQLEVDYTVRTFDDIASDLQIEDDSIFGISISFMWSI